jgi:medium-chain acyl-[acyl-carrier-protein] hydrolase
MRLFCFHHAGGSASTFASWPSLLGETIELCAVQMPGRENLFSQPRHRSIDTLLPEFLRHLKPWLDQPFAFFGHSLGGLIAFSAAHRLIAEGGPACEQLMLSSCLAPHAPRTGSGLADAPEPELLDSLRTLGSASTSALENAELRELLLPTLRDDLAMAESFAGGHWSQLRRPIVAFGGADDKSVPPEKLTLWRDYSSDRFTLRTFPGGHFYIEDSRAALVGAIRESLAA